MSKKIKSAKSITSAALSLILIGNSALFAIGENESSVSKRMFGECSVYEKAKRLKLHGDDL